MNTTASHTGIAKNRIQGKPCCFMAIIGEPTENGYAERLMRTIREEEVLLTEYADIDYARAHIGPFLTHVYNTKRPHSSLDYLTPEEF